MPFDSVVNRMMSILQDDFFTIVSQFFFQPDEDAIGFALIGKARVKICQKNQESCDPNYTGLQIFRNIVKQLVFLVELVHLGLVNVLQAFKPK